MPTPYCQAGVLTPADDQVVEDPDVEKCQHLLQALGDLAVGFALLRIAAWVIVEEDDGYGIIVFQRELARRQNLPDDVAERILRPPEASSTSP